jgi:hypothetical protein
MIISIKKIQRFLILVLITLSCANFLGNIYKYFLVKAIDVYSTGDHRVRGLGVAKWFDFDAESNIPTYYSVILLLFSAVILGVIAIQHNRQNHFYIRHWKTLSLFFLLMSLDEAVGFHENLIEPIKAVLHLKGVFSFVWVIPALTLVSVMGFFYIPFLKSLTHKTRKGFLTSATIYFFGVFVFETIGGVYLNYAGESVQTAGAGWSGMIYAVFTSLEEFCEFLGIISFISTLLRHLKEFGSLQLSFTDKEAAQPSLLVMDAYDKRMDGSGGRIVN